MHVSIFIIVLCFSFVSGCISCAQLVHTQKFYEIVRTVAKLLFLSHLMIWCGHCATYLWHVSAVRY